MKKATISMRGMFMLLLLMMTLCCFGGMTASAASLSRPGNLRHSSSKDRVITVKWNSVSGASGYEVYMKYGKNDYKLLGRTSSKNSFSKSGLKVGEKYTFRVRAYKRTYDGKTSYSPYSNTVTITATKMSSAALSVHSAYYYASLKSTVRVYDFTTNNHRTVSAGTKVTATAFSGLVYCYLPDGHKVRTASKNLYYYNLKVTTKDVYKKKTKEAYVNERQFGSSTDYLIWVNQYSLRCTIFKGSRGKWKQVYSWPCVIGKFITRTPMGIFKIEKYGYNYGGRIAYFGNYSSYYGSYNGIHNYVDGQTTGAASHGCIRLSKTRISWLATHCPVGTTVVIY
ncbi:MAG: L,D-transpeptidase family protein [Eubacteriales bacterium]|nr:L,D-transpeptidase family protein [Eubacteriales bacterium]